MQKTDAALSSAALLKRPSQTAISRDNLVGMLESSIGPITFVFTLWAVAFYYAGTLPPPYLILSVLVFALTFPGQRHLESTLGRVALDICLNWVWTAALLLLTGFATGYIREFSEDSLITWLWVAPTAEFGMVLLLRAALARRLLIRLLLHRHRLGCPRVPQLVVQHSVVPDEPTSSPCVAWVGGRG